MTREDAKKEMLFAKRNVVADSWIDQAYDVAIKALSEPEIIRCRDCRFRDNSDEYSLPCSPESDVICDDDFYCAYAERRTDE